MQYWLEVILTNQKAYDDFIRDMQQREVKLGKAITNALRDDKMEEAKGLAHESNVYENLRKGIQKEFNERKSVSTYNNQIGGNEK